MLLPDVAGAGDPERDVPPDVVVARRNGDVAAHHVIEAQGAVLGAVINGVAGVLVGALVLGVVMLAQKLLPKRAAA